MARLDISFLCPAAGRNLVIRDLLYRDLLIITFSGPGSPPSHRGDNRVTLIAAQFQERTCLSVCVMPKTSTEVYTNIPLLFSILLLNLEGPFEVVIHQKVDTFETC